MVYFKFFCVSFQLLGLLYVVSFRNPCQSITSAKLLATMHGWAITVMQGTDVVVAVYDALYPRGCNTLLLDQLPVMRRRAAFKLLQMTSPTWRTITSTGATMHRWLMIAQSRCRNCWHFEWYFHRFTELNWTRFQHEMSWTEKSWTDRWILVHFISRPSLWTCFQCTLVSVAHWHSARWAWNGYQPGSIPRRVLMIRIPIENFMLLQMLLLIAADV